MSEKKPKFNADAAEEYFSNLLIDYRNTKEKVFKEDNENNDSCNPVYSDRFEKWLGKEIAMREVLDYFSKFDLEDNEPLNFSQVPFKNTVEGMKNLNDALLQEFNEKYKNDLK